MNGASDIRRSNARALAAECGGARQFAERLARSEAQVSALIGANPLKGIGHRLAREIERVFGKPPGWLDRDHDGSTYSPSAERIASRFSELSPDDQRRLEPIIAAAIGYAVPDASVAQHLPPAPQGEPTTNGDR